MLFVFICAMLLLVWGWQKTLGINKAILAGICRVLAVIPLLTALFPKTVTTTVANSFHQQTVQVFVDDSQSMQPYDIEQLLDYLQTRCPNYACKVQTYYLSQLRDETADGYSPISLALDEWFATVGDDPWLIISDGGDFQPQIPWQQSLSSTNQRGLILGVGIADQETNVWLDKVDLTPLAFVSEPTTVQIRLRRSKKKNRQRVQVQIISDERVLVSDNTLFAAGSDLSTLTMTIPPLSQGTHLLTIKALAVAGETKSLWDNQRSVLLEVLANTIGVLHLLGQPSWDGSFLRRYLKSEPKYDLISFFILRDPWDKSPGDDRQLSLIPFPVDQLFGAELANFKIVIMQNFSLSRFLRPEHQRNLVEFVEQGGALLFIGGDRALASEDLRHSPLQRILPFTVKDSYQPTPFTLQFAEPSHEARQLASIFDDWLEMQDELINFRGGQGVHRIIPTAHQHTPLLNFRDNHGKESPLALASYPQQGRALWIVSDTFWRLAMTATDRHAYDKFWHRAMAWLAKRDLRQPLVINNFKLQRTPEATVQWQLELRGPASKYVNFTDNWQLTLCNNKISHQAIDSQRTPRFLLGGEITSDQRQCQVTIAGTNKAFGALTVTSSALLAQIYRDEQLGDTSQKLQELAELLTVPIHDNNYRYAIDSFLQNKIAANRIIPPPKNKTTVDHYWVLNESYYLFFILFLLLEVIIRRWSFDVGFFRRVLPPVPPSPKNI